MIDEDKTELPAVEGSESIVEPEADSPVTVEETDGGAERDQGEADGADKVDDGLVAGHTTEEAAENGAESDESPPEAVTDAATDGKKDKVRNPFKKKPGDEPPKADDSPVEIAALTQKIDNKTFNTFGKSLVKSLKDNPSAWKFGTTDEIWNNAEYGVSFTIKVGRVQILKPVDVYLPENFAKQVIETVTG